MVHLPSESLLAVSLVCNPFDPEEIDLQVEFTAPSGKTRRVWGFFNPITADSVWMARFAPTEVGVWKYVVHIRDKRGKARSERANIRSDSSYAAEYTYAGRRLDPETGLYYYRHRTYHSQLGRFASRDPVGYDGSPCNLCQFLLSNPLEVVDPSGLTCRNLCLMEHGSKVLGTSLRLHNRMANNPPGRAEDLGVSVKLLATIIGKLGKKLPGGTKYAKVIEKLAKAAVDGALALPIGNFNGVAIWIKVEGQCCEFESCGWLWCGERLNWKDKASGWIKCDASDPRYGDPAFPGFDAGDSDGIARALPGCIRKAIDQVQCP